jgi:hypothetical protein
MWQSEVSKQCKRMVRVVSATQPPRRHEMSMTRRAPGHSQPPVFDADSDDHCARMIA